LLAVRHVVTLHGERRHRRQEVIRQRGLLRHGVPPRQIRIYVARAHATQPPWPAAPAPSAPYPSAKITRRWRGPGRRGARMGAGLQTGVAGGWRAGNTDMTGRKG